MADEPLSFEARLRQAALDAMTRFADQNGCANREWREHDDGRIVQFVGTTDDGRDFTIGYERRSELEAFTIRFDTDHADALLRNDIA
jgi:hypothetical protein